MILTANEIVLLSKIARTKIESKSQLIIDGTNSFGSCYQRSPELKLKANHNWALEVTQWQNVVIKDRQN